MENKVMRCALYIRVSGKEQAIKGLSLEAQREDLEEFVKKKGWIIAGVYTDAAKTARKNIGKRSQFLKMIEDVKQDKIDMILFTRLDRWFRSVADYYKVIEILEAHNCGWLTTQEQYDSTTAGGRLYINLRLSIAQNEADLTAERIKAVNDSKIKNGTVLSGKVGFWYKISDEKTLEPIPEKVEIVRDIYNYFESSLSIRATVKYTLDNYGMLFTPTYMKKILTNKLVIGIYESRGRENRKFCNPVISEEQFYRVQALIPQRVKSNPTNRVFLFTSLLRCGECGKSFSGIAASENYYYYRCTHHFRHGNCSNKKHVREETIEQWLLENLAEEFEKFQISWEAKQNEKKVQQVDVSAIRRKLKRLKDLYINEIIDLEEYKRDYDELTKQLESAQERKKEKEPDFDFIKSRINRSITEIYTTMTKEEKRSFWRSIVSKIYVDATGTVSKVIFL